MGRGHSVCNGGDVITAFDTEKASLELQYRRPAGDSATDAPSWGTLSTDNEGYRGGAALRQTRYGRACLVARPARGATY